MQYPEKFEADLEVGGYVVTFRDIPEAITQGDTEAEAMAMARDALAVAMDFYFEDKRDIPSPSQLEAGERLVSLSAEAAARIHTLQAQA